MFDVSAESAFDFNAAAYRDLYAQSRATAFQHPVWLDALYRGLATKLEATPLVVTVRCGRGGPLVMVLPLLRRRYAGLRVVEFADLGVSDYAAPVCTEATFEQLLDDKAALTRVRALLKPYDMLRIGKLCQDGLRLERLLGIARREEMGTNAYATPLAASMDAWQSERLQRSYVKELAKKSRQLHRRGAVDFGVADGAREVDEVMRALQGFRGIRFANDPDPDIFQLAPYFGFYRSVAAETEFARVYRLRVDGVVAASALTLIHDDAAHVVLSGFDEAGFGRQSVGSLLFQFIASDSIARGLRVLDFTIGDEPYKLSFGATASPMWRVTQAGTAFGRAADLFVRRMPAARGFARRIVRGSTAGPQKSKTGSERAPEDAASRP